MKSLYDNMKTAKTVQDNSRIKHKVTPSLMKFLFCKADAAASVEETEL